MVWFNIGRDSYIPKRKEMSKMRKKILITLIAVPVMGVIIGAIIYIAIYFDERMRQDDRLWGGYGFPN